MSAEKDVAARFLDSIRGSVIPLFGGLRWL